jgi:transcriptional regulator with XRE-family HTH domain
MYYFQVVSLQGNTYHMVELAGIRHATGVTQVELAAKLGVGQAQVSKIERQSDMLLSTLASYLSALGVEATFVVKTADGTLTYDLATVGEGR